MPIASSTVDTVVSYIVWVDVPDFRTAIAEAARVLKPGGHLVAANLSFITASTGWGTFTRRPPPLTGPLTNTSTNDQSPSIGAATKSSTGTAPLSAYMQAYLSANLILRRFLEPVPPDDSLRNNPRFEDWYRIPEFTVMRWQKP